MLDPFMAPGPQRQSQQTGLWVAVVSRVTQAGHVYVRSSRLWGSTTEVGPAEVVSGLWSTSLSTSGGDHSHSVPTQALAVNDRVLIGFLEGRTDRPVVVGRLA